MKTLLKMTVIGGLLIMTSMFVSNVALAAGSGKTTIVQTYTNTTNFAVVLANGAKPCGGNGWWGFNHTTTAGARMMATLMLAYASGRPVLLHCTAVYGGWNNIVSIYTYQ